MRNLEKSVVIYHPTIPGRVGFRYEAIGHGFSEPRNLLWWWDGNSDSIHRRQDRGGTFHCDILPDSVDIVWRGRVEKGARASILPPLSIYAYTEPDKILVPVGLVRHLRRRLGGVVFYVDTKGGLRRVATDAVVIAKTNLGSE